MRAITVVGRVQISPEEAAAMMHAVPPQAQQSRFHNWEEPRSLRAAFIEESRQALELCRKCGVPLPREQST